VLLTSGSIDVSNSPVVMDCEYQAELQLPDGTTVYVPDYFERVADSAILNSSAVQKAQHWLGHPGYVISLLNPDDLRQFSSPTVDFLAEAADYGARLFLSTPRVLRIPRPLRWLSTLTFQSQSPAADDAAIRGLLILAGAGCIPNYGFKDLVEHFGHGATIDVGYDTHRDPAAAVALAVQQVAHEDAPTTQLLVVQAPVPLVPWEFAELVDPTSDGPCVCTVNRALRQSEASYYHQLV
jgi:hypothetical protein